MALSEHLVRFFEDTHGVVEATSFEHHSLWLQNRDSSRRREWKENLSGYGMNVGEVNGSPVFISLLNATIDGKKILFYHATSVMVDWAMIEHWLCANMPKSAFRSDGRLNKTDSMNFHNVF